MAVRRFLVGGNWKCNNTLAQSKDLINNVYNKLKFDTKKVEVVCAPVFVHLPWVAENVQKSVQVSAQNSSVFKYGAYTGEIFVNQLKDIGVNWTILGHSERRQYQGESSDLVAQKTKLAIEHKLSVMACIGETLEQRESNNTFQVLESQLTPLKTALTEAQWANVVIAYEPVWAIGTGKTATAAQAQEVHAWIRQFVSHNVSGKVAKQVRILYGGSVTEKNSDNLIKQKDIDGFLVGGAALKPAFTQIVDSCNNATK